MNNIEWKQILNKEIKLKVCTNVLPKKGNMVYEYNPFRNYRLSTPMYEYEGGLYNLGELYKYFGITLNCSISVKTSENNIKEYKITKGTTNEATPKIILEAYQEGHNADARNLEKAIKEIGLEDNSWIGVPKNKTNPILREANELVDFITDEFKINIEHPVTILPQYSYDGSVNLIINDGINTPRLINSRFSTTGKNTYEVIDRKGNNDTNIYDLGNQFDIDTSLYKRIIKIPKIKFLGESSGGHLKVGNYHFYFKLLDADGNETDFVGESGLVSVFIGFDDYTAVHTGVKNENSLKTVNFLLSNIDSSYDYVSVYYSRSTAEGNENLNTEYVRIDKKYLVNNADICNIAITGTENITNLSVQDINQRFNTVDASQASEVCLNMLFLANVHKPDIPYNELLDLSLRFLPYLKEELYTVDLDENYRITSSNKGYIDPLFIYNKTGYWGSEIYRFGIVYIMKNGDLSPVFNIRGGYKIKPYSSDKNQFTDFSLYNNDTRKYINYNEETYLITDKKDSTVIMENVKGVVQFEPTKDTNTIYSVDIKVSKEVIEELKKYVKGYFFVRQERIPTILALGITIGIDQESRLPTIPTVGGVLEELSDNLKHTYVTTKDINDVNFISEGFLLRYSFTFKPKHSNIWKKIGKVFGTIVGVAALAAATIVSAGAVGAIVGGATIASAVTAATGTLATLATTTVVGGISVIGATGIVAGGIPAAMALAGGIQETVHSLRRLGAEKELNGRATKTPSGYKKVETDESRTLNLDFKERIIIKDPSKNTVSGILCPDFEINQPTFNQIFTGNKHLIQSSKSLGTNKSEGYSTNYFNNSDRHFYIPRYDDYEDIKNYYMKIIPVSDSMSCAGVDDLVFKSRAGEAEEAWRYESVGDDYKSENAKMIGTEDSETISNKQINSDIVRGEFGPYLAINDISNKFEPAETVNIYTPGYSSANISNYYTIRMNDSSTYGAVSDRYDINNLLDSGILLNDTSTNEYSFNIYRGDCYLCLFTHRINRNFCDPTSLYNDEIVEKDTWKEHYDPNNSEEYALINSGDVNAIKLGMWVTFRIRSSNNLNIRTLDGSDINETTMTGHPKGYYPYYPMLTDGNYKHKDSDIYNKGFTKKLSDKFNILLADVPYIKNWFGTRIMYSDIHINDAYKNGFRVFLGSNYKDYTRQYGEIVKLIELNSNLICVFEHGVALLPINERAVANLNSLEMIYLNIHNVLPEKPVVISDMFGSQWPESVLKTPGKSGNGVQYIYGVDTVAKKIWRTDGQKLECISDFKVLEFLNNNISLGERELTPKIGIRNVKTVYNAFKADVMFTFYDNTYGFEEKVWNLCFNEKLNKFITFYSWVPSYMENINNIPFSFNRDVSKWIAKLGTSHSNNSLADGITLSENIIKPFTTDKYIIGKLNINNRILPENIDYQIIYELSRDNYQNYKKFNIELIGNDYYLVYIGTYSELCSEIYYRNQKGHVYSDIDDNRILLELKDKKLLFSDPLNIVIKDNKDQTSNLLLEDYFKLPIYKNILGKRPTLPYDKLLNSSKIVILLNIKAHIKINNKNSLNISDSYYSKYVEGSSLIDAGYYESTIAVIPEWNLQFLSTDFWRHGLAGIIDIADDIYPTYWYGKLHPFEFECVVVDDPSVHKIFDNLEIVSNKAKPESFHYEIIGQAYDFANDKPNMYFRQEAKKAIWQYNGSDITYNRNFLKTQPRQLRKSADFPSVYYARQDLINEIYDEYISGSKYNNGLNKDYSHLSGSEISYYPNRQEYRIWTHAPAISMDDLLDSTDHQNNSSIKEVDYSKINSYSGGRSIIGANCKYLEDKWEVSLNPIIITYKNEYTNNTLNPDYSTWKSSNRPPITVMNSPIPDDAKDQILKDQEGNVTIPLILTNLGYSKNDMDFDNWLNSVDILAGNRKELDIKDKFIKIRIRYSGEDLVLINFLKTLYRISYA